MVARPPASLEVHAPHCARYWNLLFPSPRKSVESFVTDDSDFELTIVAVGRKLGSKLIVDGEEFYGHQANPAE
jgi:hypothetical protein